MQSRAEDKSHNSLAHQTEASAKTIIAGLENSHSYMTHSLSHGAHKLMPIIEVVELSHHFQRDLEENKQNGHSAAAAYIGAAAGSVARVATSLAGTSSLAGAGIKLGAAKASEVFLRAGLGYSLFSLEDNIGQGANFIVCNAIDAIPSVCRSIGNCIYAAYDLMTSTEGSQQIHRDFDSLIDHFGARYIKGNYQLTSNQQQVYRQLLKSQFEEYFKIDKDGHLFSIKPPNRPNDEIIEPSQLRSELDNVNAAFLKKLSARFEDIGSEIIRNKKETEHLRQQIHHFGISEPAETKNEVMLLGIFHHIEQIKQDVIAQKEEEQFQQKIKGVQETFGCVARLGDLTKNKELIVVGKVGQATIEIYRGMRELSLKGIGDSFSTLFSLNSLDPIAIIFNAGLTIFGLFQKHQEDALGKALGSISQQIAEHHKIMVEGIRAILTNQQTIINYLQEYLPAIHLSLNRLYNVNVKCFAFLQNDFQRPVITALNRIESNQLYAAYKHDLLELQKIEREIIELFCEVERNLENNRIDRAIDRIFKLDAKLMIGINSSQFNKEIETRLIHQYDAGNNYSQLITHKLNGAMGLLGVRVKQLLAGKEVKALSCDPAKIVNLNLWFGFIEKYIDLITKTKAYGIKLTFETPLRSLKKQGEDVLALFDYIKINKNLIFKLLIKEYFNALLVYDESLRTLFSNYSEEHDLFPVKDIKDTKQLKPIHIRESSPGRKEELRSKLEAVDYYYLLLIMLAEIAELTPQLTRFITMELPASKKLLEEKPMILARKIDLDTRKARYKDGSDFNHPLYFKISQQKLYFLAMNGYTPGGQELIQLGHYDLALNQKKEYETIQLKSPPHYIPERLKMVPYQEGVFIITRNSVKYFNADGQRVDRPLPVLSTKDSLITGHAVQSNRIYLAAIDYGRSGYAQLKLFELNLEIDNASWGEIAATKLCAGIAPVNNSLDDDNPSLKVEQVGNHICIFHFPSTIGNDFYCFVFNLSTRKWNFEIEGELEIKDQVRSARTKILDGVKNIYYSGHGTVTTLIKDDDNPTKFYLLSSRLLSSYLINPSKSNFHRTVEISVAEYIFENGSQQAKLLTDFELFEIDKSGMNENIFHSCLYSIKSVFHKTETSSNIIFSVFSPRSSTNDHDYLSVRYDLNLYSIDLKSHSLHKISTLVSNDEYVQSQSSRHFCLDNLLPGIMLEKNSQNELIVGISKSNGLSIICYPLSQVFGMNPDLLSKRDNFIAALEQPIVINADQQAETKALADAKDQFVLTQEKGLPQEFGLRLSIESMIISLDQQISEFKADKTSSLPAYVDRNKYGT